MNSVQDFFSRLKVICPIFLIRLHKGQSLTEQKTRANALKLMELAIGKFDGQWLCSIDI